MCFKEVIHPVNANYNLFMIRNISSLINHDGIKGALCKYDFTLARTCWAITSSILFCISPDTHLSVLRANQSSNLGSSSARNLNNCTKLNLIHPQHLVFCLPKNLILESIFKNTLYGSCLSIECWLEHISPISQVVAGKVTIFSMASHWYLLASCDVNLEVASFQLVKPVEIYVFSRLGILLSLFSL